MTDANSALRGHIARLKALRGNGDRPPKRLAELKRWQSQRLQATYADLSREDRFREATDFFLEDLYGPKDFSGRDEALLRIVPVMERLLPASALETATLAIELEALSEELDHRVAKALPPGPIDAERYGKAYREAGTREEREHQIALIVAVGERLDALVRKPLLGSTLKLMRQPARLAGLSDLQDFLERGFDAFRAMGGAKRFLDTIEERETQIARSLFAGEPLAFAPP